MTKDQLVDKIVAKCGCSKKVVHEFVANFEDAVTQALTKGDEVRLVGFGTFSVVKRAARMGVNPKTLEKIKIAATKVPKFKAGKSLKMAVK
ncbi:MAG: HU family DNA-binding protein [Patescibacteria group bacterium]